LSQALASKRVIGPAAYMIIGALLVTILLSIPVSARGWFLLGALAATLVCVLVAISIHRPPARGFWWLVAFALALWLVGGALRVVNTGVIGPWVALFLVGYVSALAAVWVLGKGSWGRAENLVDTAIVALAVGGALLTLVVEPELRHAGLGAPESGVLMGYPLLGTLLFAAVLRCAFGAMSRSFSITALVIGLAALAVTAAFLPAMNIGVSSAAHSLPAVGSLIGYVSLAVGALDPSMRRVVMTNEYDHPAGRFRLSVLGLSVLLLPVAALWASLLRHPMRLLLLSAVAVPLAALVAARMLMLIRAVERRARSFEEERSTLKIVLRNLPLAIWATDLNGTITLSDGKAVGGLGFEPGELVGRSLVDVVEGRPEALDDNQRALEGHATSRTIEFGGIVWEAFVSPLRDTEGSITGTLGVALDVTDRVRPAEQLAERELHLRQAEQIANIGSWSWDIENDFVTWSDQLYRIYGTSPDRLNPTFEGVMDFMHPDDRPSVIETVMRGRDRGSFTFDARIVRGDGERRFISARGETIYAEGAAVGMFGVVQDVTEAHREIDERKDLEEQLRQTQKMEAVGRLAGGIAHDFNNLLTAIMGHAGLLLGRDDLTADIRDDIREIENAAGAGRDITSALLDIGQRRVVDKRHLDVNEVLLSFEPVLRRLIGEDIGLILEVAEADLVVNADQGQLEQVMLNLALNARDAMQGGGTLTISTEEAHQLPRPGERPIEGPWVVLSFADTGGGIDPGTEERIFEPFFSTKDGGRSRGLGLSIVYGIVQDSGGYVDVVNAPRTGTKMRTFLPLSADRIQRDVPEFPAVEPDHGPATILLVEDEAAVRSTTQRILSRRGYSVVTAVDGLSALEIVTSDIPIDLLVTDVVMPNLNGVALAEQFLQSHPRAQVIYIPATPRTS
jgi:two-component system cell cycle sensor histidine kinase/response regulator CckA